MVRECAVLDANVLYAAFIRDVLLSLFAAGLYEAKWTHEIHDEWVRNLLADRPHINPEMLAQTVVRMNGINPSPLVEDYQVIVAQLELPDPGDRHILAAAITAKAKRIVTWNLKDFPQQVLDEFGIAAESPDDFLADLIIHDPEAVVLALRKMRERMLRPKVDAKMLLGRLSQNRLQRSRRLLERFVDEL
jgi:predicted nucleic acid-binding protein